MVESIHPPSGPPPEQFPDFPESERRITCPFCDKRIDDFDKHTPECRFKESIDKFIRTFYDNLNSGLEEATNYIRSKIEKGREPPITLPEFWDIMKEYFIKAVNELVRYFEQYYPGTLHEHLFQTVMVILDILLEISSNFRSTLYKNYHLPIRVKCPEGHDFLILWGNLDTDDYMVKHFEAKFPERFYEAYQETPMVISGGSGFICPDCLNKGREKDIELHEEVINDLLEKAGVFQLRVEPDEAIRRHATQKVSIMLMSIKGFSNQLKNGEYGSARNIIIELIKRGHYLENAANARDAISELGTFFRENKTELRKGGVYFQSVKCDLCKKEIYGLRFRLVEGDYIIIIGTDKKEKGFLQMESCPMDKDERILCPMDPTVEHSVTFPKIA